MTLLVLAVPLVIFTMPETANVVPMVTELLTVSAFTVALPVVLSVDTTAVLPPALPNVPLCGPLNELLAVYVAPVNTALALPIVAAWSVVPFNVPLNVRPVNVPTAVILLCVALVT